MQETLASVSSYSRGYVFSFVRGTYCCGEGLDKGAVFAAADARTAKATNDWNVLESCVCRVAGHKIAMADQALSYCRTAVRGW